jgi:hypothetical protein
VSGGGEEGVRGRCGRVKGGDDRWSVVVVGGRGELGCGEENVVGVVGEKNSS